MTAKKTLVMKFGGTSVGTVEAMRDVTQITKDSLLDWTNVIIVTSALSGITNLLIESATRAANGDVQTYQNALGQIRTRHFSMAETLLADLAQLAQIKQDVNHMVTEFANLCEAISVLGEATPRAMDAVAALGERLSARLLAAALVGGGINAQSVEATQLIVTDKMYQSAHPDFEATNLKTRAVLLPLLDRGVVPVITGFIGATPEGVTTTLGRGGSDYSAAILAAALPATEVWIWTDVDGVMTADPRLVPDAKTIPVMYYKEVAELAYFGAKVLHPKTIRPVIEANIGLRVCNTFNPSNPGTRLVEADTKTFDIHTKPGNVVKAVTVIPKVHLITIEGRGMLGVPGVAARAFGAVAETGTSVILITQASSEQSICFAVPAELSETVLSSLRTAFAAELSKRDIDSIWSTDEVLIVTVVGAGMRIIPGVAGRVFNALGEEKVNVIAIAQGSSEVSLSLIVDSKDLERAVKCLHRLIVEEE